MKAIQKKIWNIIVWAFGAPAFAIVVLRIYFFDALECFIKILFLYLLILLNSLLITDLQILLLLLLLISITQLLIWFFISIYCSFLIELNGLIHFFLFLLLFPQCNFVIFRIDLILIPLLFFCELHAGKWFSDYDINSWCTFNTPHKIIKILKKIINLTGFTIKLL